MLAFGTLIWTSTRAQAEDPFAGGADALAVANTDGSASLRAKIKLKKLEPDMIQVQVVDIDDNKFPQCTFTAKVMKAAESTDKYFKMIGVNKTYQFAPVFKMKKNQLDLTDKMTQNNLGACYYPKRTVLILRISDVDLKAKTFQVSELYLK
jgi:hypothetical protein